MLVLAAVHRPGTHHTQEGKLGLHQEPRDRNFFLRIHTIETLQSDNKTYIRGPVFKQPADIEEKTLGGCQYYKTEVFFSGISLTYQLSRVQGKCLVLDQSDYCTQRPTQHQETDVYCCRSYYDVDRETFSPLYSNFQQYEHCQKVKKDEVYVFKRPISPPQKVALSAPIPITDPEGSDDDAEPPHKRPKPGAVEVSDDEPEQDR